MNKMKTPLDYIETGTREKKLSVTHGYVTHPIDSPCVWCERVKEDAKKCYKEADPECPCWVDGFETADAEQCFEKVQDALQKAKKRVEKLLKPKDHVIDNPKENPVTCYSCDYNEAIEDALKAIGAS